MSRRGKWVRCKPFSAHHCKQFSGQRERDAWQAKQLSPALLAQLSWPPSDVPFIQKMAESVAQRFRRWFG